MSEGTRFGLITDLVVQERGPKLRFKIGGTDAKAWATVRDGVDGPEYPNPCISAIKMAFAQETPIALDGWEKVEDDFYSEKAGRTIKGKPMFFAQRVVEASQHIFGETFQKALGIDAMGNKVQGGGPRTDGEGGNRAAPPSSGWAETPPDAVGAAFSGHPPVNITEIRGDVPTYETSPVPVRPDPAWLNSEYSLPYLGARLTAAACVFKAFDIGGDALIDEWKLDGEDVRKDKPRILARQVKEIAEALVRGDL